jgi:histidine triad (HIT) family protein
MCLFCKIVEKEIPANIELENEEFLAFHDINPIAPIHLLIIPKNHVESFQEVKPKTMADMTTFIQELAKKMGLDKDGYRLLTNIGENGGQEIKHLHFHLVGGTKLKWVHLSDDMDKAKEAI